MSRHKVVALVDDEPAILDVVQRAMRRRGDVIRVADTLAGGRALILESAEPFDCAIIDINLPDGDGLSLANEVHARLPGLRVALITGGIDEPTGVFPVLHKPFTMTQFWEAIG